MNLPLPSFPNIFSKIWSQVLNWRPMSQIHSANIFLLQWLFWVAVFVFLFIIHFNWITSHLKLRKFHIVTWLLLKKYTICQCGIHILQDGNLLDVNDRSFSHGKQASIYHKCQQVLFFLSWLTLFIYYLPGPRSHFRIQCVINMHSENTWLKFVFSYWFINMLLLSTIPWLATGQTHLSSI